MQAVIIAGGKGARLRPYTYILPKPLLPIGQRSILEINLRQLKMSGVDHAILAIGYLGELIQGILGDGQKLDLALSYSSEDSPLGTVGALSLMKDRLEDYFIVMNGDILHNIDFAALKQSHLGSDADVSITVCPKEHQVNLGVLDIVDGRIRKYIEKPTSTYYVSSGIYVMKKEVVEEYVAEKQYMDFPTLINLLIKDNKKIFPFHHDGLWIDLGTESEYQKLLDSIQEILKEYPTMPILL